jgi:Carboxypeptidase regulatory-like domain
VKASKLLRSMIPWFLGCTSLLAPTMLAAQGVTTGAMNGLVTDPQGGPIANATVVAIHVPSGTQYRAVVRPGGAYGIPNMRIGGPYRVTVAAIGFQPGTRSDVFLNLGEDQRLDFRLERQVLQLEEIRVTGEEDKVLNAGRSGAATFIDPGQVTLLPSIKRSTRDLTRLDPRSDGNFSFAGRNWLYNNVSLDGSYFNNPFGLDDPAPGGQTNAEPVPYDAVEQVQVSVAPFDIRQGGFTGANINTVTKSGTNEFRASLYGFYRSDQLLGNTVRGEPVIANPDLNFIQSGFSVSGPLVRNKLFFYLNAELERTDDPGTNFVASTSGTPIFGQSRVQASVMDRIRNLMIQEYDYDPGPYQGYVHETNNNKLIAKLDWNISQSHNLTFRYNFLDASRDLPPHPFVLSFNNTGRGPNQSSLPFRNSGYTINNNLNSLALEVNSRSSGFANRFFASFNRFRDHRDPFSEPFPTIEIGEAEIGEAAVQYTTLGHEPFSINNILDQDVWQFTDNFTWFQGRHAITFGANYERFGFFNSFNIFRHGFFPALSTYSSLAAFFAATEPGPNQVDFRGMIGSGPFKGELIDVGQLSVYAQDEFLVSDRFNLTYGLRADFPMYYTDPVDNPYIRSLPLLDENDNPETVDQSKLPGTKALFSPRVGFNWNAVGDRQTQIRGGTGIFTGRVPFVWIGNNISNPGPNPNLYDPFTGSGPQIPTRKGAILQQSFFMNAMDPDFKWPQVWTTDLAVDQRLPWELLGTLEVIYGKDLKAVFVRNANLRTPVRTLPDGRPYFGGAGNNELTLNFGAGPFVIDNTEEGHSLNVSAQVRKVFSPSALAILSYSFTEAKNNLKSTEIASVLWETQPVQGDPNRPGLANSEFGQRHRIVGAGTWSHAWSPTWRTQLGVFLEVAEGNRFSGAGGNRYSFIYSGDVNGDGTGGNDLIYIPRDQSEINFVPFTPPGGPTITPQQQWDAFNAFIEQDSYLRTHRGQIAERFGLLNPWYHSVDLRILQDFAFGAAGRRHAFQFSVDILNLTNLLNSDWGVRKVARASATSPLTLVEPFFNAAGEPLFNFTGPSETFIDDPSLLSRWRGQIGLRYFLNY